MKPLPYILILVGTVLIAAGIYEQKPLDLIRTVLQGQKPTKGGKVNVEEFLAPPDTSGLSDADKNLTFGQSGT